MQGEGRAHVVIMYEHSKRHRTRLPHSVSHRQKTSHYVLISAYSKKDPRIGSLFAIRRG